MSTVLHFLTFVVNCWQIAFFGMLAVSVICYLLGAFVELVRLAKL
jgi:hypothetical protein